MTDRDSTTRTPSEGLWGGGVVTHHGGALSSPRPDTVRNYRSDHEVHEALNCRSFNAACLAAIPRSSQRAAFFLHPLSFRGVGRDTPPLSVRVQRSVSNCQWC